LRWGVYPQARQGNPVRHTRVQNVIYPRDPFVLPVEGVKYPYKPL
jgi:hypothetical protein